MFKNLIGKTMEVYVKDMIVKSKVVGDHVKHLRQMFDILKKYRMKLNPLKYAFGVWWGYNSSIKGSIACTNWENHKGKG